MLTKLSPTCVGSHFITYYIRMALFSKPKVIIWPHLNSVEIFTDQDKDNRISFDLSLFKSQTSTDLQPLAFYLKKNNIKNIHLLLPDDIVLTKSFLHDSKIDQIDQKELLLLAKSSIDFEVDSNLLPSQLIAQKEKTIIKTNIIKPKKFSHLITNINSLSLNVLSLRTVSQSLGDLFFNFYQQDFFLLYSLSATKHLLFLAKQGSVYLSEILKGKQLEVQKIINYSKLYFSKLTSKLFIATDSKTEIISTSALEKTTYDSAQICQKFNQAENIPLPVLSILIADSKSDPNNLLDLAIIKQITMPETKESPKTETTSLNIASPKKKKNILPVIAVFVVTASIVSVVIWYVLNQNGQDVSSPVSQDDQYVSETPSPTATASPTPTLEEISKDIGLQVLNATEINGQAGSFKATLVKLGFTDVSIGNSSEKLTQNELRVKEDGSTIATYFEQKLAPDFSFATKATLDSDSDFDAVFVIATDLRDTPVPSQTDSDSSPSASPEE